MKVICHTSIKYAVVNENNFYHSINLKFQKSLNFSKTSLHKSKIFSEHLEIKILQTTFNFERLEMVVYQKMFALNPVFCVYQNGLFELLSMIMLQNIVEAVWRPLKVFLA